jgi:hypothetical protein
VAIYGVANFINVASAASLGSPTITAAGSDADIALTLAAKGTGLIQLNGGATGGVLIGVNAAAKVGFFATTPVVRGAAVPDPAGGATVDTEARAAIVLILARLRTPGFIAT